MPPTNGAPSRRSPRPAIRLCPPKVRRPRGRPKACSAAPCASSLRSRKPTLSFAPRKTSPSSRPRSTRSKTRCRTRAAITTPPCATSTRASSSSPPTLSPVWAISTPANSLTPRLGRNAKSRMSASAPRRRPESSPMLFAGSVRLQAIRRENIFRRFSWHFCPKPHRRALVCLALLLACFASASARTLRIRDFHAELDVLPDSSLDVTETIHVDFDGAWQGIYRNIPVEYAGPGGLNYSLFLTDISATDSDGAPLRIEKQRSAENLQLKIFVPAAEDTSRNISLHYRVRDGLRFFEDHDELYWNVTGTGWDFPIESASAHIILPVGVTGLHAANFIGFFGSRSQDARMVILGSNIDIYCRRPLAFHEGLTLVAGWDKGFVHEPRASEKIAQFLDSNWPLFLPVGVFLVMFWLKSTRGRDPRVGAIAVQYEPPAGLSPGEAGTLVDNQAGIRDITATLVDLAVRGFITIEEKETSHLMGLYSNKEYVFHLNKKPAEWKGVKPHELLLLTGIFGNPILGMRDEVALSELQNSFYKNLPAIRRP